MGVYVDALIVYPVSMMSAATQRAGSRHGHRWCHMIADTESELHAMAQRIGLRRAWFQRDHYDLTPPRRDAAIRAGAIEMDRRTFVSKLRATRALKQSRVTR